MNDETPDEPLDDDEIGAIVDSSDPFVLSIRGMQAVEEVLNLAIAEVLAHPHYLEISRMNIALKVDLGAALGVVIDAPLLSIVNRLRNRFAHNRDAVLTQQDARELVAAWPVVLRQDYLRDTPVAPTEVLAQSVFWLFVSLQAAVSRARDSKAEAQILGQMMLEALQKPRRTFDQRPSERFRDRLRQAQEERRGRGLL